MTHSDACVRLAASFEGLRTTAYQDTAGIWTIGYGHTEGVLPGMKISEADAEAMLNADLAVADAAVNKALTVDAKQNQFDAFVSLCFNIGAEAFHHSTAVREFNAGNLGKAADAILLWCKVNGKVSPGLLRRRQAERAMFLEVA